VNNGIRNMAGYGSQIPPADRWAIVAYVRALQRSQATPAASLPADVLNSIPAN
jgi:mono/diheme cytochrome c family protein